MRTFKAYWLLARPHQYLKNSLVWLPLFFGHKLYNFSAVIHTFWAFLAFCLAASSTYVLNDLLDLDEDRRHPLKRLRPLASGVLNKTQAGGFALLLAVLAMALALSCLPIRFVAILTAYLVLSLCYSTLLKRLAIVDVMCIALGFVLRVFAGGMAAQVPVSHWIVTMTFLLALFLAFAKRRDDLGLALQGHNIRKSLSGYGLEFISLSMAVMAAVIIVAYILYTVSPETIARHGSDQLYLTGFWVVLGILRYLQVTFVEQGAGSPTLVLWRDHFLQMVIFGWLGSFYLLLYGF